MTCTEATRALRRLLIGAIGVLVLTGTARAQQVYWEAPGAFGAGQRASLDLVFADTEPSGAVEVPAVDDLTILGTPAQQSSISIINGTRRVGQTLSFPVRAEREGRFTIPSFDVETADGTLTVRPLTIDVGAATLPGGKNGSAAKVSDVVDARLTPSTMTPYAGEVFDVGVIVGMTGGRHGEVVGTPKWDKPGVVAEAWSDGQVVSTDRGSGVRFHTRAVAPAAGRVQVAPIQQEVAIESGRERIDPFGGFDDAFADLRKFGGADLFSSFFSRGQKTSATVRSNSLQLDVQPLPQPAPEGFSGAVGQFELKSTLAPAQLKTGEPITWTLTLSGTGNWPGGVVLPARAIPNDFRALQPKQHQEFADGQEFSGRLSEDLVLVPNTPGDYHLSPVRFVYFDPAKGKYQTLEAQPPVLHITGAPIDAPQPQTAGVASSAPAPAAVAAHADAHADAPVLGATKLLPRDPKPGHAVGSAPLGATPFMLIVAAPLALVILYWIGLALRRARLTDPRRPQRLAFGALAPAIERVRAAATADDRIAALLAWQHTVAVALGLDLAAPTAAQLRDQRWIDVWAGSERALYGREHALPGGWCDRALSVCTRTRRPRFNPLRAFTVRHLVPKAATAMLLLVCAVAPARAEESKDAYGNGDFAGAHDQYLAAVKETPSDWIARYNLGLAAAQLGDAPRALAETIAAFVHAPNDEAVRWNAQAFAAQVPGFDRGVAALVAHPGLAGRASPAVWQAAVIAATFIGCIGAALMLRRRYQSAPNRSRCGLALLVAGIALAATAAVGLRSYGPLADARVALVTGQPTLRSVPTDAEQTQQQKPLAAGTLVVVERDFLGWVKVGLRGGESGWLRHADLVPLYAAPTA